MAKAKPNRGASKAAEGYSLKNPFDQSPGSSPAGKAADMEYAKVIARGEELLAKPLQLGGPARILQQHAKGRMTVLERVRVLTEAEPNILFQNWGPQLDGASILTAILNIERTWVTDSAGPMP